MSPPLGLNHFTFSPGSRRLPASHSFANRLCDQPFRFWHLVNEKLYLSVVFLFYIYLLWTIGSGGKEVTVMQETGFDSWVGKIPWRSEWLPTPVVFPGEFHGQRSLMGYSPWVAKSWTWLMWASLVAKPVKNPPAMQETQVWSLDQEDPLEKWMATYSSILAWRIPWTEEPGRLQFMGSQKSRTWLRDF